MDIFDFAGRKLARRYPIPGHVELVGVWLRRDFYLYGYDGAQGELWKVNQRDKALGLPLNISFPDSAPSCAIYDEAMFGAGSRMFLYEAFGGKGDRRPNCDRTVAGGIFSIDPGTGNIGPRLAGGVHFASLVPSPDGKELYAIDVRQPSWESVELVRVDAETGSVLVKRELMPDVWFIDLARVPRRLVPQGELEAVHE